MPAYAYLININYEKAKFSIDKSHEFDDSGLTIKRLEPIVGDHVFNVEEGRWGDCTVHWTEYRLETDEEYARRIAKQEAYNAEVLRRRNARS